MIRCVLGIAVARGRALHQIDVRNAFLNGDINETIFICQPLGFVDKLHPNKVCRLRKAIYGLRQALRSWYSKLNDFLD